MLILYALSAVEGFEGGCKCESVWEAGGAEWAGAQARAHPAVSPAGHQGVVTRCADHGASLEKTVQGECFPGTELYAGFFV